jgi:major membrane immunogen (membrane-anchored lipoprotein)
MNKLLTLPLLILCLSGCESKLSLAKGEQVCKDNNGLYSRYSRSHMRAENFIQYTCKDGKIIKLSFEEYEKVTGEIVTKHLTAEKK